MHLRNRCSASAAGNPSGRAQVAGQRASIQVVSQRTVRLLIITASVALMAAKPPPAAPTAELVGSDLEVKLPIRSDSPTLSDAEFEQALENSKAAVESKERMAAVLAKEKGTYGALKLRGQEQIDALERAARDGEATAAEILGDMLDTGDHLKEDPARAIGYYRAAALGGRMEAAHSLGVSYSKGRGAQRDFREALAWLIVARQRGDKSGVDDELRTYLRRHGHDDVIGRAEHRAQELLRPVKPDVIVAALPPAGPLEFDSNTIEATTTVDNRPAEARKAAPRENPPETPPVVVTTILGQRLTWPSLEELQHAANRGDPAALTALGRLLASGKLIPADPMRAVVLLERAAAMGEVDAAHQLGDLYAQGDGIVRDDAKAFSYFLQAAQSGSPLAMANVGVYYTNGRGTKADLLQGLAWLTTAKSYRVDLGQEKRLRDFMLKSRSSDVAKADELAEKLRSEIATRLTSAH